MHEDDLEEEDPIMGQSWAEMKASEAARSETRRKWLGLALLAGAGGAAAVAMHPRVLTKAQRTMRGLEARTRSRGFVDEEEYKAFLASLSLRHISPMEVISPHRNVLRGVGNSLPPKRLWKNIREPLRVADELRNRLNVPLRVINSAFRSPEYNTKCGGAKRSYHMRNMALDLIYDCSPLKAADMARKMRDEGVFKGGIGVYSSFIHIDTRGRNANW